MEFFALRVSKTHHYHLDTSFHPERIKSIFDSLMPWNMNVNMTAEKKPGNRIKNNFEESYPSRFKRN